jgi:ferredoxin-NADP reductase
MPDNSIIKRLKIIQIIHETKNAKTFVLEPLDGWNPDYKPGQFITIIFHTKHGEKRRSYSISSSPFLKEALSITIKKVDNGEFSRYLLQHAKPGDVFHSSGIAGFFTLPQIPDPARHFCFLAAGSGITPCFSLIKTILGSGDNKVTLIYSNRNREDVIFFNALLELQEKYASRFTARFLYSENNDLYNKRMSKWLLEHFLLQYFEKDLDNTLFYLCGPYEYMQTIEITLMTYTSRKNIIKENFSSLPRLIVPRPPDTDAHRVTIRINNHEQILTVQYPRSILAVAKENKVELPYSCEAGRCGSCAATCVKGKIWMAYNEVLVDEEVEDGRVLVCQGFPVGGDAEIVFEQ